MQNKKERSAAQKAADARYRERNPNKEKNVQFKFKTAEADEIQSVINNSGMTKADFLRRAVELYKKGEF